MYKNRAYIIKTKTNLHAGSDGTNFGIVDKEVQRDTISNLPIINGSSLKGAIRDHFAPVLNDSNTSKHFIKIFGDDNQGLVKFVEAKLLFLPLRSNIKPYFHVTSYSNLEEMIEFLNSFNIKVDLDISKLPKDENIAVGDKDGIAVVEDVECKIKKIDITQLKKLFGIKNLAIFKDKDFNEAVANLPVIARNKVKTKEEPNGNLWYEEVVPRESILYTVLSYYQNIDDSSSQKTDKETINRQYKKFNEDILKDDIQIGANASIGYGICNFSLLGESNE